MGDTIIGICTVLNEADIIELSVRHHLGLGCDAVLLNDDGSTDGTTEMLEWLARTWPVIWSTKEHPDEHLALDTRTRLARQARALGADWVVPFDADIFWIAPNGSLRDVLQASPEAALIASQRVFVQSRDQRAATREAVLHMTRRPTRTTATRAQIMENTAAYVELAFPPHVVFRADDHVTVEPGFHSVMGTAAPARRTEDLVVLHAPLRAYDVLVRKARHGLRWRERFPGTMGWHWKRFAQLLEEEQLEEEWRANSHQGGWLDCYGGALATTPDDTLHNVVRAVLES